MLGQASRNCQIQQGVCPQSSATVASVERPKRRGNEALAGADSFIVMISRTVVMTPADNRHESSSGESTAKYGKSASRAAPSRTHRQLRGLDPRRVLHMANVWLCCGRFHKMQVGGRAVPKGTTERGRPPASLTRPTAPTSVRPLYGLRSTSGAHNRPSRKCVMEMSTPLKQASLYRVYFSPDH